MHCTLDSRWSRSWIVVLALVGPIACSDDGVPQDETGSGTTGDVDSTQTDTMPTTDDPATTSPSGTTATTDPSTSVTSTDPSDTSGTTDDPTDPDSSSTAEGTTSDTSGTDTSGTDTSGSSDDSSSGGSSSDDGSGVLPTGADCVEDNDCASGVCWDFSDYDQFCFGAACSVECQNDDECVEAFEDAGAQAPQESFCGRDGRCWVVGTGFGGFACAMEPAAMLGG